MQTMAPYRIPSQFKIPIFEASPPAARNPKDITEFMKKFTRASRSHFGFDDNGKIDPTKYGSISSFDLGLCYETHFTHQSYRLDSACIWRHSELTSTERSWIVSLGANRLGHLDECQSCSVRPVTTRWDMVIVQGYMSEHFAEEGSNISTQFLCFRLPKISLCLRSIKNIQPITPCVLPTSD
jgi:hypothetical protein